MKFNLNQIKSGLTDKAKTFAYCFVPGMSITDVIVKGYIHKKTGEAHTMSLASIYFDAIQIFSLLPLGCALINKTLDESFKDSLIDYSSLLYSVSGFSKHMFRPFKIFPRAVSDYGSKSNLSSENNLEDLAVSKDL